MVACEWVFAQSREGTAGWWRCSSYIIPNSLPRSDSEEGASCRNPSCHLRSPSPLPLLSPVWSSNQRHRPPASCYHPHISFRHFSPPVWTKLSRTRHLFHSICSNSVPQTWFKKRLKLWSSSIFRASRWRAGVVSRILMTPQTRRRCCFCEKQSSPSPHAHIFDAITGEAEAKLLGPSETRECCAYGCHETLPQCCRWPPFGSARPSREGCWVKYECFTSWQWREEGVWAWWLFVGQQAEGLSAGIQCQGDAVVMLLTDGWCRLKCNIIITH